MGESVSSSFLQFIIFPVQFSTFFITLWGCGLFKFSLKIASLISANFPQGGTFLNVQTCLIYTISPNVMCFYMLFFTNICILIHTFSLIYTYCTCCLVGDLHHKSQRCTNFAYCLRFVHIRNFNSIEFPRPPVWCKVLEGHGYCDKVGAVQKSTWTWEFTTEG